MASRKKASKTPNTVDVDELLDEVKEEESDGESDDSLQQNMSLDVLAQVATETLERSGSDDSSYSGPSKSRKTAKGNSERMTLEQIRMLSDKLLVNTFAELQGDELKRKYTYQCYLMPDKCQEMFSSFGNEAKARQCVKAHLLAHIGSLLQEECTPGKGKTQFTAEPLNVMKRRLAGNKNQKRKRTVSSGSPKAGGTPKNYIAKISQPVTTYTTIKKRKNMEETPGLDADDSDWSPRFPKGPKSKPKRPKKPAKKTRKSKKVYEDTEEPQPSTSLVASGDQDDDSQVLDMQQDAADLEAFQREGRMQEQLNRQKQQLEKEIIDSLSLRQPFQDHSYTTVFGAQVIVEAYTSEVFPDDDDTVAAAEGASRSQGSRFSENITTDGEDYPARTITINLNDETAVFANNIHIPIIRLSKLPVVAEGLPIVSAEEVVRSWVDEEASRENPAFNLTASKPYPPMPKSDLANKGKIMYPEEYTSSDEEGYPPPPPKYTKVANRRPHVKSGADAVTEMERKIALKCIRELRCKKKEEVSLVCKICKDKAFTATATLMYHYRSHAGIKPFVCLICNTTFTRQHSLNYHMLIHNNQSRFTCKDCGRKFRHPSHFKEHMRRHTGETPFHCMDCPLRFKTRNTYKRHLKTRHGKLLTADGIQYLTREEFNKVMVPKTKIRFRGIQTAQSLMVMDQENQYEDEDDYDDDEEEVEEEYIQEFGQASVSYQ